MNITIYAHRDQGSETYRYVGATTNLKKRWSIPCVVLEVTDLAHQVERETFWINKLRGEGHPLRNRVTPGQIALGAPATRVPLPVREVRQASAEDVARYQAYRARKRRRSLLEFADWYCQQGMGAEVAKAREFLEEDQRADEG